MENNKPQVKKGIHKLMQICEDSARGYRNAADHVEHSEVKSTLYKIATDRTKFIGELQDDIRQLDIEPERIGSIGATFRRIMINVKAAFGGIDDKALLEELERGEKAAMKAYEKMLRNDLPEFIKQRLDAQHQSITEVFNTIKMLEKKLGN